MPFLCNAYHPSGADTERFWQSNPQDQTTYLDLPAGFPNEIKSTFAWNREDIETKENEWKLCLNPDEVEAVNTALAKFECEFITALVQAFQPFH